MQNLSEGADRVTVEGNTVRKIIDNLEEIHTGFKSRLLDNRGRIKPKKPTRKNCPKNNQYL